MDGNARVSFFEKVLSEALSASSKGWGALKFLVMFKKKSIEAVPLPSVPQSGFESKLIKDDHSLTLYPSDAPQGRTPVRVYGDGNCLYRTISLSLFGCEKHHVEIRVRTLFELVHNEKLYSNEAVLGKMSESAFLMTYFLSLRFQMNAEKLVMQQKLCRMKFLKLLS